MMSEELIEMLNETLSYRNGLQGKCPEYKIPNCGQLFAVEGIGNVYCCIRLSKNAQSIAAENLIISWKLNGKSISSDDLNKAISA